jgi:hypothetical protein
MVDSETQVNSLNFAKTVGQGQGELECDERVLKMRPQVSPLTTGETIVRSTGFEKPRNL